MKIILFDGVCNLCNSSVDFIIKRDYKNVFMFAALQSERGRKLLETTDVQEKGISSLILIDGDKFYTRSDAVLRIAGYMKGIWKLSLVFFILPRIIRDTAYQLIESRRYIWFGKRNSCRIPTSVETKKFLL